MRPNINPRRVLGSRILNCSLQLHSSDSHYKFREHHRAIETATKMVAKIQVLGPANWQVMNQKLKTKYEGAEAIFFIYCRTKQHHSECSTLMRACKYLYQCAYTRVISFQYHHKCERKFPSKFGARKCHVNILQKVFRKKKSLHFRESVLMKALPQEVYRIHLEMFESILWQFDQ